MVKSAFSGLLLGLALFSSSAFAGCRNLPESVKDYLSRNPQWHLVDIKDLIPEDRALWRRYHKDLCPGLARARLDTQKSPYFVLALLREDKKSSLEKLIAIPPQSDHAKNDIILTVDKGTRTSVVWKAGPGKYDDVVTGQRIRLKHDTVIYEVMEAGAITYYLSRGHFKYIQTSE